MTWSLFCNVEIKWLIWLRITNIREFPSRFYRTNDEEYNIHIIHYTMHLFINLYTCQIFVTAFIRLLEISER